MTRGTAELAAQLRAAGAMPDGWQAAFEAVDRAAFVPRRAWFGDAGGLPQAIEYGTEEWARAVYSDEPVVTQLDEGRIAWPATSRLVTSSASQPSVVLRMLGALDVHAGHTVLEIGTGTGYNAALLGARLGDEHVTTVDVDPVLAEQARSALRSAGRAVTVVTGDGVAGYRPRAPYDRVIATAAVLAGRIPHAWIEQTRPGGLVLTPWGTAYRNGGLLRLTVHGDGTASGTLIGDAAFMRLRQHSVPFGHASRLAELVEASAAVTESVTRTPPASLGEDPDATTVIGLMLPGVQRSVGVDSPQHWEVLLYDVETESAALACVDPDAEHAGRYPVRQCGPRRLWDEAESCWHWWTGAGRPARTRLGVTVTPAQQWCWLDTPDNIIQPLTECRPAAQ